MKILATLLIAISTLIFVACGPSKPLTPEEQALFDTKVKLYTELFEQRSFVLEADRVYSKKGRSFQMNSTINFVKLEKGTGVVQLAFSQIVGWNGMGGITLDGDVRNYKINKGDGTKMPSMQFDMNGTLGWATVRIDVNSNGNARATVDAEMSGDRISFSGTLLPSNESRTFQGTTLF